MVMNENRIAPPAGAASREATSVEATISRLMDGEVDDAEFERCVASLRSGEAMEAWICYHVIGDSLPPQGVQFAPRGGPSARMDSRS
jgi:hypothetical protein